MPAPKFIMPALATTPALPADGIYFDMSFADYLAAPAFGSGLLYDVLVDPLLCWSRSWMNGDKPEEETKDHLIYGQAFHCRILEGADEFEARFYVAPVKDDYPDLLVTDADVKKALEEFEEKPRTGNKDVRVAQLRELWPDAPIWDEIVAEAARDAGDRQAIKGDWAKKFELSAQMIEQNPALLPLVSEGYSEVSLFWHCPLTGIPKKARMDKLQLAGIVDVKTFANMQERSLRRAIPKAISDNGYPFQMMHYLEGAAVVRSIVRAAGEDAIGSNPHTTLLPQMDERRDWCKQWAAAEVPDTWTWLFIQKGDAPTVMAVEFPLDGVIAEQFDLLCQEASHKIVELATEFGAKPWAPLYDIWAMEESMIPAYAMEV